MLDPGHGGSYIGARGLEGLEEKDVALDIAKRVRTFLRNDGIDAALTRSEDVNIPLGARLKAAHDAQSDLFISVHANSAGKNPDPSGIEVYFFPGQAPGYSHSALVDYPYEKISTHLKSREAAHALSRAASSASCAQEIITQACKAAQERGVELRDRGVKTALFRVLLSDIPSILVEVGFVTNPLEARLLAQNTYRSVLAYGIAQGITKFLKPKGV